MLKKIFSVFPNNTPANQEKSSKLGVYDVFTMLMALFAIWGAGIYYFYALNRLGIFLAIIGAILSLIFLRKTLKTSDPKEALLKATTSHEKKRFLDPIKLWSLAYIIIYISAIYLLLDGRSDRPLISPWEIVSPIFFLIYGSAGLCLSFILTQENLKNTVKIIFLSSYYFLTLAIAILVYKIAYGFDPFVHLATMELIAAKGLVLPKTVYYIGEYGLTLILHQITNLPLSFLNKILLPVLAACLLPSAISRFVSNFNQHPLSSSAWLSILFLPIIGVSALINTTPQNLSYLFLILSVLAGAGTYSLRGVLILVLAAASFHPLTGLPALAWWSYLALKKYPHHLPIIWHKLLKIFIFSGTIVILPLAMIFGAGASFKNWHLSNIGHGLNNIFTWPHAAGQENWIMNFVYLIANNQGLIFLILIITTCLYVYRHYIKPANLDTAVNQEKNHFFSSLIIISLALAVSYLIILGLSFPSVIDYEKYAYAERLPIIIIIFLLPTLVIGSSALIKNIFTRPLIERVLWLIFGLSLLTASLYLSYPRLDKYWNSRGYSTSADDIAAVLSVAADANAPYLVLANQQVSAAALSQLGFDHYYSGPDGLLYFYPIPTGGPLYQYYLDMVYQKPDRDTMRAALDLANLDLGYFIINKYWRQSAQIINTAKVSADTWWDINGEVYIFKYQF